MSFDKLYTLDVNSKTEKKKSGNAQLTYLSWAYAWAEFVKVYPDATYEIVKNDIGLPYFLDKSGAMVYTKVTANNLTHEMWLPVMNGANKAMKSETYTYMVKGWNGKPDTEKSVEALTMFDVNKTVMRCLVKNLAMFGLGLYIYAGEDLPEAEPVKLLDKNQVTELVKLIADSKTTLKDLISALGWNVSKLEEIQETNFDFVKEAIISLKPKVIEYISKEQVIELESLFIDDDARKAFLTTAKIESIDKLPLSWFDKAKASLEKK